MTSYRFNVDIRYLRCPVCNREMRVKSNGRFMPHNLAAERPTSRCAGSGKPSGEGDRRKVGQTRSPALLKLEEQRR